jgi:AraC-like ligand binding domain
VLNDGAPAPPARTGDLAEYHSAADIELEAMRARFQRHVYHRHSHETYPFGVNEPGSQAFRWRGGSHVSVAGLVMAFNPDDPHDGAAATPAGFADQAHLTRWFVRCLGITPGAYRRTCAARS